MRKSTIAIAALSAALLLLAALVIGKRVFRQASAPNVSRPSAADDEPAHPSLLYGRITTVDDVKYEGRIRFGGRQEAFWGDYFNGVKTENPWAALVPPAQLPKRRDPFRIFGLEIFERESPIDLNRLFMIRFGDITRIQAIGRDVRVTLKSGAAFDLARFEASDFDDGVSVWDPTRGMTNLDSLRIRSIELLPSPTPGPNPDRLHGTVRTTHATFTGFVQWDRELSLGSDSLAGRTAQGDRRLLFSSIRSIARHSAASALVTLLDGRQVQLSGTTASGQDNRGVYVDDPRYGRVLVSWRAFETMDFTPAPAGPAYTDFPPGSSLTGEVTTRDGRRIEGRLVFDLDESETTETLDAPSNGIDYTLPFGLVSTIDLHAGAPRASVTLHSGEQLQLNLSGDLGSNNAGMLIFTSDAKQPEYVRWSNVAQIQLDRPPAMYPPFNKP
jgi:hypothetical protein